MSIPTDPKARRQWNDAVEKQLAGLYSNHDAVRSIFNISPGILTMARLNIQSGSIARELVIRIPELCTLQRDLSVEALKYLGRHDLEANWKKTPHSKKLDLALNAICLTCSVDGFEDFRILCPEMTTKGLSERFISFLKIFTTERNAKREGDPPYDTPIYFENEKYDRYMKPPSTYEEELRPFLQLQRIFRTYVITLTIWYMLLAFYDREEGVLPIKGRVKSNLLTPEQRKAQAEFRNTAPQEIVQKVDKQHKIALASAKKPGCSECGKRPEELGQGVKMMTCSRCNKMGIRFNYCSKQCQVQDWKNGHKKICGVKQSPLEDSDTETTTSELSTSIEHYLLTGNPETVAPFVRSPALLYQISLIGGIHSDVDYVIMQPGRRSDSKIFLPSEPEREKHMKVFFHVTRRRAMMTGDRQAVYVMYNILWDHCHDYGIPCSTLRDQLLREYGVLIIDGDDNDIGPQPPQEELDLIAAFLDIRDSQILAEAGREKTLDEKKEEDEMDSTMAFLQEQLAYISALSFGSPQGSTEY